MSELEARVKELERKMENVLKLLQMLGDYVKNHEAITEEDTKLFDNLNTRVKALENSK